jgi:ABC-type transport system involved in multi-copper enzyme maturation permease subunit
VSARPLARRELRDAIRRWWFVANASVFAVAGALFVLFGQNDAMLLGERGYGRALAGLMQLGLVFVPLMALVPATAAIAGEREAGTLDYLLAQPVTRAGVYRAKWVGVASAVVLSVVVGLSLTAAIATLRGVPAGPTAALVACTALLALPFVSLGCWISSLTSSRTRATSFGLSAWITLLGLGSLGVMSAFVRWGTPAWVLEAWSLGNPVEAYRMATLAILRTDLDTLGPVGAALLGALGREGLVAAATASLAAWAALGYVAGRAVFVRAARSGPAQSLRGTG